MFNKIVVIEPVNFSAAWMDKIRPLTKELVCFVDIPASNAEIIRRIGDADGVLLSYTSQIDAEVLRACPQIRYIGMCCSLYAPESANVDIRTAQELGIVVTGIRDYGDEGVREYVISELVRLLHGFGPSMWRAEPMELTGLKVGILGMGVTGKLVADALRYFGCRVFYYSRSRKTGLEKLRGYQFLPLDELLPQVDILCTCLNKNVVLLDAEAFELFGDEKIIVNTSIGPSHDIEAAKAWLKKSGNYLLSDTAAGIDPSGDLLNLPNALCAGKSAGVTTLAKERLGEKVLANLQMFLMQ